MRAEGNIQQWSGDYPTNALLLEDIARGFSYVVEDEGQIIATFVLTICKDPTYKNIYEGNWLDDESEYGTIHRIASRKNKHGVLATVLDYSFTKVDNIRIDTHRDNKTMKNLMQRHGFTYCGIIYLLNGDERLAYQKLRK